MFTHPDYTVVRELGHGGAASVYLAVQKSLERRVAVKVLHAAVLRSPDAGARFLREARTVAMLEHRHVVPVFEIGRQSDEFGYFMTMEYLPGGTLQERRAGGMTVGELLRALDQVAAALACAHAQGIVHRDVKSDNILFRENGDAVLSDFGIARLTESLTHMTATGAILGTAGYMSPEQVRGETLDPRSDLYSLGIVLYEMIAGQRPFVGDSIVSTSLQHITTPPPPLDEADASFRPLVERLLAKSPDERPPDAEALRAELARLAARLASERDRPLGEPRTVARDVVAPPPATRPATPPAAKRRRRGTIVVASALVGLVAVGLGRSLQDTSPPVRGSSAPDAPDAPDAVVAPSDLSPLDAAASAGTPVTTSASTPTGDAVPTDETSADARSGTTGPDGEEAAAEPSPVPALVEGLDEAYLGERWFDAGPDGAGGAIALSRRVQAIEPDNARAARRLEQMREATRRRAERALENGELASATARIDELEDHWPEETGALVATLRAEVSATRVRREAAALAAERAAERRRAAESALAEAERALLDGELDRAGDALSGARAGLPGDERVATVAARLDAARERVAETRRAREAVAALDARIDALANRFDDWSDSPDPRLDATWEALDADLKALFAAHPDNVAVARLNRVAERQATLLARSGARAAETAADDSAERFHLPGF